MVVERGRVDVQVAAFVVAVLQGIFQHGIIGVDDLFDDRYFRYVAYEPAYVLRSHEQEGDDVRVIIDVAGADVQQPGDFVERGEEHGAASGFLHLAAQPGDFLFPGLPHGLFVEPFYGRMRNGGAVRPEFAEYVGAIDQLVAAEAVGFAEGVFQLLYGADALTQAVESNPDGFLVEMGGKPFRNQDFSGNAGLMEFDTGSGELSVGLDEIAGVGPQAGMVLRNDQVAGFAGETARPFDLFPSGCKILASMRIGAGNDHGIIPQRTNLLDPSSIKIVNSCHILQI